MGLTCSKLRRAALCGLWLGLAPAARGDDLPPLPPELSPPAPTRVDAPAVSPEPVPVVPERPVNERAGALMLWGTEKPPTDGIDWDRVFFVEPPPRLSPFRTTGVADFGPSESATESAPTSPTLTPPQPTPIPEPPAPRPGDDHLPAEADPAAVLAETTGRLDTLPKDDAKDATAASKALRAALEERLSLLKEWEKVVKERHAAENPEPSPEKLAADWKADLERVTATLDQTAKDRDALLPASFRNPPAKVPEPVRVEMKDAIDAAQTELKEWTDRLERFRSDPSRKADGATAAARASRDKSQRQLTGLKARNADRAAALEKIKSADDLETARVALVNGQWEARIEAERLRGFEALLTTETRRSELAGLNLQVLESHTQLAQRTLDRMKQRYQAMATLQERDLHQAAAEEQTRAERSDDPVEGYRARRAAALLELEARVVTNENALTTDPPPNEQQQRDLADRAEADFVTIKSLLDDGKVSRLDALRLNNDFRRLGPARSRIVKRDLAVADGRLTWAENSLSEVEIEMINDARDDRFELDNLLERVPAQLRPKVEQVFKDFEVKHLALLNRRRVALEKLAQRAELTHQQVLRRLRILDDHFGFIRTHMFWVRDEAPVSGSTVAQAQRELRQLGRDSLRIGAEVCDRSAWGRLSVEFLVASFGLVVLPWPLRRLHQALRSASIRPASSPEG